MITPKNFVFYSINNILINVNRKTIIRLSISAGVVVADQGTL